MGQGWSVDDNGVLTVKEIHADKLCLGNTCITEDQLRSVLNQSGTGPAGGGSSITTPTVIPNSDDSPVASSTDPVIPDLATSTPPIITPTEPDSPTVADSPEPPPPATEPVSDNSPAV